MSSSSTHAPEPSSVRSQMRTADYVSLIQLLILPIALYVARFQPCDTPLRQFVAFHLLRVAILAWPVKIWKMRRRVQEGRKRDGDDNPMQEANRKRWDSLAVFLGFKSQILGILSAVVGGMWLIQDSTCTWKTRGLGQAALWCLLLICQGD
ncbi:hypothetical protein BT69DRAFT_1280769 [Atractiella rhizophila]|nr:hypothetical protein BT69DRAFT_1280769 [Atractiella rhizophila]